MSTRLKLGMILISIEVISDFFLNLTPRDDIYYVVAGAFSFLVMPAMAKIGKDKLVVDLLNLALLMLVSQMIGFVIYHSRLPVEIYNYTIHLILTLQFLRLLLKRRGDGVDQNNNMVHLLRCFDSKRNNNLC